jgi:hypothetical protein
MAPMIDPTPETAEIAEIARLAAARLADVDPDLTTAMDRTLAGQERPRRRGLDANLTLTLASFVFGLVQFGWSIYRDQRQDQRRDRKEETREILVRRLRVRIEEAGVEDLLPPGRRDRVVEVVVEEILALEGSSR